MDKEINIEQEIKSREELIIRLEQDMLEEMRPFITIIGISKSQIEMLKMKIQ